MVLQILLLYKLAYAQAITITAQCPLQECMVCLSFILCTNANVLGLKKQELSQY